tara:strand:+ start:339 stop:764 length:426 start_codon:yes stop_codon:yes gene_type:complete
MSQGYIQCYRQQGFISISVVALDNDGVPVVPDSDPLAELFRIDPNTGTAAKDLNINGLTGEISLPLVAGSSFLYSGALDLSEALFEHYEITVTYSYNSGADTAVHHIRLFISNIDQILYESRNVTVASVGTTFKAPTPDIP